MSLVRHPANPVLTRADIPPAAPQLVDVSSVFNPGAVLAGDRVVLLLRVQNRGRETFLCHADSDDGIRFRVRPGPVPIRSLARTGARVHHVYDPRITRLGDLYWVTVAMDLDDGCRVGLCRTRDFAELEFVGFTSADDSRNGVLFPEKLPPLSGSRGTPSGAAASDGSGRVPAASTRHALLDRPNSVARPGEPTTGSTIALSFSDDLLHWERAGTVARGRWHYWDELIGPGPPPVKTRDGWLLVYHGVATHFQSVNIYQVGVMLLDLKDPTHVVARSRYNQLEPREVWELTGQVPNVVFPSGLIVRDLDGEGFARPSSEVLLYYGAADTCVGLVTGTVQDLLDGCVSAAGA